MDFSKDLNQEIISFMKIEDLNNYKYTNRAIYKDSKEILDAMTFKYTGKIGISLEPDGPIHKEESITGKIFLLLEHARNYRDEYYKLILRLNNDATKRYEFDIYFKKVISYSEKNKIYKLITYVDDDNTHITIGNFEGKYVQIAIVTNYRGERVKYINLFVVYKDLDASQKNYLKIFFEIIEKIPDDD